MSQEKIMALATRIVRVKSDIDDDTELLKSDKAKLVELVGDEGQTINTGEGKVTVPKRTLDRPSGKIAYALDPAKFLELDAHVRANLIKKGIVLERGTEIKGQAPTVKVTS